MALVIRTTPCSSCVKPEECATRRFDRYHCRQWDRDDDSVNTVQIDVSAPSDAFGEQRKAGAMLRR